MHLQSEDRTKFMTQFSMNSMNNIVSTNGAWGIYIWTLQNRIVFQSSTSEWWTATNGIPVTITNVMVGILGDYGPASNVVDIGPSISTNFPGANYRDVGTYQVDITNVFYEVAIPEILITPRNAKTCVGGSNVPYTVTGTNITNGVTWMIYPTNFEGHALLQTNSDWHLASVTPGSVATNYKVRATSVDKTNFYDEVNLTVLKVDIMETNVYVAVSNTVDLHLSADSYLGGGTANWSSDPSGISGSGTSITVNAANLSPTTYVVRAQASLLTNCYDSCTVTVVKVEFITPAGDPTNAPIDSGDGQNEFTFLTNNPGVLDMNLKAKVTPDGIASQIVSRCQFLVDGIGNSSQAWSSENANGQPTVSNNYFVATVTFTSLPTNNAAFGSKKAAVYFDSLKQDEKTYEVFFPKWGYNNPSGGTNNPNWFYYWKDGGVCGIDTNCIYDGTRQNTWGYCQPGVDTLICLCALAPESNSGPESYYSHRSGEGYGTPTNGEIIVTGNGKGIKCVAETIRHEGEHLNIYNQFHGQTDTDGDGIRDISETTNSATSYDAVASDSNNADTYNMGGTYSSYGDNEIRCRKLELNLTITIYPDRDWANPGCQSKNKFGP